MPRPTPIIRKVLVTAAVLLAALAGGLVYVVQPIGWRSSGARPDGVDPVRLEAHVRMLAETLAPRHWKRQDNLDRAAAYVAARLGEAGARVTEQVYAVEAAGRYRNVIGSFGPEAGERVIVGAHYDGAGPFAAADDNASGVAGLLELARLLGTGRTPATRVDLVAFTLEEPPYYDTEWMGSHVHAAALRREGVAAGRDGPRRLFHERAGLDPGHRLLGPPELLGPGLPGGDGHRHGLLPQRPVSHAARHAGHARLPTHGRRRPRRPSRGADARAMSQVPETASEPSPLAR